VVFVKIADMQKLTSQRWQHTEEDHLRMQELLREMGINPDNFYQELEMSSRYVNTHRDVSFSTSRVNLHSHNYVEILYCKSSSDVEYLIGSDRYRLQKGDIVYIPPGISHRPIMPEKLTVPYERDVLWISTEFIDMVMNILIYIHIVKFHLKAKILTHRIHKLKKAQQEYLQVLLKMIGLE
jgi:mannose-6-phosphate isomerase-like protein (cupin superfamily)